MFLGAGVAIGMAIGSRSAPFSTPIPIPISREGYFLRVHDQVQCNFIN
jgi:hypothetical protein